jgi:hypothetical protein
VKKLEEELNLLGESLKKVGENKIPPSDKCFENMENMVYYHENILGDKEKEVFATHLKDCLWCFNSYMEFSTTLVLAEEGTLEPAPEWVNDIGMNVFKQFDLSRRLEASNSTIKDLGSVRLSKPGGEIKKEFSLKEAIELEISISMEPGGYITVFHFDSEGKASLIFPHDRDRNNFIKREETKFIKGYATLPPGQASFKVFFTESQLVDPEKIAYKDDEKGIVEFLEHLEKLNNDYKWSAVKEEYKVLEKEKRGDTLADLGIDLSKLGESYVTLTSTTCISEEREDTQERDIETEQYREYEQEE